MKLRPDEITKVLRDQIEDYSGTVEVEEVGTVLQVGDGIARVYGLDDVHGRASCSSSPNGVLRPRAQPRRGQRRRRAPRRRHRRSRKATGQAHRPDHLGAGRRGAARPRGNALGDPLDGKGPIETDRAPPGRGQGARRGRAPAGEGAAADRHQGHRRDDPDRPRPARADHRRPPDRQDRVAIDTIINQKGQRRASASTSPSARSSRRWPPSSSASREPARWTTRSSSPPRPPSRRRCSTSRPTPAAAMGEYFLRRAASTR